tara:strand:+ start:2902 stop:3360 length:459 start_codon:yes stop_codon:yes gene_type:complete
MSLASMKTDLAIKKFNADIGVWTNKHASHLPIQTIQRKIALDVLRHAVMYTPVKTGYLRFNWQVGINTLPEEAIGTRPKTKTVNKKVVVIGKKLPRAGMSVSKAPKYSIIYISNPVEYAEYVEEGSPTIKAHKMLARALQDVRAKAYTETEV